MSPEKQAALEAAGYRVGDAEDFLHMNNDDIRRVRELIESKTPAQRIGLLFRAGLCTREQAVRAIEDIEDAAAAEAALADPRPHVPWKQVKAELGLE